MAAGDVEVNITKALVRGGAEFDGVDDIINFGNDNSLKPADEMSVSLWVKSSDFTLDDDVLSDFGASGNRRFLIQTNADGNGPGILMVNNAGASAWAEASSFPTNKEWHHFLGTYDGTTTNFYVDGVLDGTTGTVTGVLKVNTADLIAGGRDGTSTNDFAGSISDIKFFNKALTQTEATTLANNGTVTRGLVSRWKLDADYTDSVGSNDGTNTGTVITLQEEAISSAIAADRTTPNDKYMLLGVAGQVISTIIEETP